MIKQKCNLGCGVDIKEDCINVDKYAYSGVDVIWDLNECPLPFENERFETIYCLDILEHIDYVPAMKEIHRILKPNGKVIIRVPHYLFAGAYTDPTHIKFFSYRTFENFTKLNAKQNSLYGNMLFSKCSVKIDFERSWRMIWNYPIYWIVNLNNTTKKLYERTPLSVFPPQELFVELEK